VTVPEPEPELADGEVDALLRPLLDPELFFVLPLVPELLVPELLDAPVLAEVLPEAADAELAEAVWCAPGRANATAPAVTTLITPAVAVTVRSRACPRSRSAMARPVSCACLLIGQFLLGLFSAHSFAAGAGPHLLPASEPAMSQRPPRRPTAGRSEPTRYGVVRVLTRSIWLRAVSLWRSLGFEILATVPEAFRHPVDGYVGLHIMYRRL
jgi:hypothetical protein